mmetsp:Transcript_33766/g.41724  ORF Transcript_33766/g.41724 Transcript_33766/m.41724 type:complete len:117 (+) Transcript_33766:2135-2485(+)
MSGMSNTKAENVAKASVDHLAYSNQMSQLLLSSGSPVQSVFLGQKAKEEVFLKNNLEYEQRLKAHLYQFDDEDRKNRTRSIEDSQMSDRHESRAYVRETPGGVDGGTSQMANQPNN